MRRRLLFWAMLLGKSTHLDLPLSLFRNQCFLFQYFPDLVVYQLPTVNIAPSNLSTRPYFLHVRHYELCICICIHTLQDITISTDALTKQKNRSILPFPRRSRSAVWRWLHHLRSQCGECKLPGGHMCREVCIGNGCGE